jgi:hypothetical protein
MRGTLNTRFQQIKIKIKKMTGEEIFLKISSQGIGKVFPV